MPFGPGAAAPAMSVSDSDRDNRATFTCIDENHARRVGECYKECHSRLVHWLVPQTGSRAAARDIADQAFWNVLRLANPAVVADMRQYVFRAAHNLAARRSETTAIRRRLHKIISHEPQYHPVVSPEADCVAQQRLQLLRQALQSLPPRMRLAFKFHYWDGVTYKEILERFAKRGVHVNVRTVKRWVAEGLERCRQEIERYEGSSSW